MVMFFGMCNSPATFQAMMDSIFDEEVEEGFVIVYMDDVLIFTPTLEKLIEYERRVMKKMIIHNLFLKARKCAFHETKLEYLSLVVEEGKLAMDPVKVKGLAEWPILKTVKYVCSFLGFGNFYRKFIGKFSTMAEPLNSLLKKNIVFSWTDKAQAA